MGGMSVKSVSVISTQAGGKQRSHVGLVGRNATGLVCSRRNKVEQSSTLGITLNQHLLSICQKRTSSCLLASQRLYLGGRWFVTWCRPLQKLSTVLFRTECPFRFQLLLPTRVRSCFMRRFKSRVVSQTD